MLLLKLITSSFVITLLFATFVNAGYFRHSNLLEALSTSPRVTVLQKDYSPRQSDLKFRSFLIDKKEHWPTSIIPYEVDPSFNSWEQEKLGKVFKLFQTVTCLRFVPRVTERDYIRYTRGAEGCSSAMGRQGGRQDIFLTDDCFYRRGYRGALVHETMHALGFVHEQQRPDRDCYVTVFDSGKNLDDYKYINSEVDTGFPYDVHSIMHYKGRNFMKGKQEERLGNYKGTLTPLDIQKLNYLYCGQPYYCDLHPEKCTASEKANRSCKEHLFKARTVLPSDR